jgi:methylmalonic aciduria homocystinuria type C protein
LSRDHIKAIVLLSGAKVQERSADGIRLREPWGRASSQSMQSMAQAHSLPPWRRLVNELAAGCLPAGLDLVAPLQVAWYNRVVETEFRLPDFERVGALAVLIGNTRALWPCFVGALRRSPTLLDAEHPLETYVVERLEEALTAVGPQWLVRWAHQTVPAPVAMQRLAEIAGLATLAPSHLSVHPVYGPWISLRAVVVVDVDGPPGSPPRMQRPCDDCERRCTAAFRHALAATGPPARTHAAPDVHWERWLAVRDACPIGSEHRFDEDQTRYHYTKDRQILRRAAAR